MEDNKFDENLKDGKNKADAIQKILIVILVWLMALSVMFIVLVKLKILFN